MMVSVRNRSPGSSCDHGRSHGALHAGEKGQVRELATWHTTKLAGVCSRNLFEKTGWPDTSGSGLLVNATIGPVTVPKREQNAGTLSIETYNTGHPHLSVTTRYKVSGIAR
jgi:hypothetical protein